MDKFKGLISRIPNPVKKVVLLFLTIAVSCAMFWYSRAVLGLPAMDSGIVPATIIVFVIGLLYVPYDEDEE